MHPLILLAFAVHLPSLVIALSLFGLIGMASFPFPLVPGNSPDAPTLVAQADNIPFQYQTAAGSADAITGGGKERWEARTRRAIAAARNMNWYFPLGILT